MHLIKALQLLLLILLDTQHIQAHRIIYKLVLAIKNQLEKWSTKSAFSN